MEQQITFYSDIQKDVRTFLKDVLLIYTPKPKKELIDKEFDIKGKKVKLFDKNGRPVYHDLRIYKKDWWENQNYDYYSSIKKMKPVLIDKGIVVDDEPKEKWVQPLLLTWQQELVIEAYQRALDTFDKPWKEEYTKIRQISVVSGHGIGKSSISAMISLHFILTKQKCNIGATANTADQLEDVFMKEIWKWREERMPWFFAQNLNQIQGRLQVYENVENKKIDNTWFLRARVARPEKPEALSGIHSDNVLLYVDEASGVADSIYENIGGALTAPNWIMIMTSNPTRTEGYFYDSQKDGSEWTKLKFDSEESPIVSKSMVERYEKEYDGRNTDQFRIRVKGLFPSSAEMDDKGWIPAFSNVDIHFESDDKTKILRNVILGVDPAGTGKDRSIITARDNYYMKKVLDETTSTPRTLARKIEMVRDAYNVLDHNIGIDAFGIGAVVENEYKAKNWGESIRSILADKPREDTKDKFVSFKDELWWNFRQWLINGGVILTNNQREWMREFEKIKFKRDLKGRIKFMGKVDFKKEYGFSPDLTESAIYSFFRLEAEPEPTETQTMEDYEINDLIWAQHNNDNSSI